MIPLGVSVVAEYWCQLTNDDDPMTIVVHVRDRLHAVTENRINSILVCRGSLEIDELVRQGDEQLLGNRFLFVANHINRQNIDMQDLNSYATVREKLMEYLIDLALTSVDQLKIQSTYLHQVTEKVDQLTRPTLVRTVFYECNSRSVFFR